LITTSQPASANARAQALPSPRLDAQTMALRPEIPDSWVSFSTERFRANAYMRYASVMGAVDNTILATAADIAAAAKRLAGVAVRTPLINAPVGRSDRRRFF
jgi:hypothetical protein